MSCERCALTDDEAEAVRGFLDNCDGEWTDYETTEAVLRRLLQAPERVEHRLVINPAWRYDNPARVRCTCGAEFGDIGPTTDLNVRAWATHAGIGGTEP